MGTTAHPYTASPTHTIIVNNKYICKPDMMVHTYKPNTREGQEFEASLDHMMKNLLETNVAQYKAGEHGPSWDHVILKASEKVNLITFY